MKGDDRDFSVAQAVAADINVVYYLAAQVVVTSSVAQRNGSRCTVIFGVFYDVYDNASISLYLDGYTEFRRVVSGINAGPTQGEFVSIGEGLATTLIQAMLSRRKAIQRGGRETVIPVIGSMGASGGW